MKRCLHWLLPAIPLAVALGQGPAFVVHLKDGTSVVMPLDSIRVLTFPGARGPRIQAVCLEDTAGEEERTVTARITDPDGVARADLHVEPANGVSIVLPMFPAGGDIWSGLLPALPAPNQVRYHIEAADATPDAHANTGPTCGYSVYALAAPVVTIERVAGNRVRLDWAPVAGATAYHVYTRGPEGGDETLAAQVETPPLLLDAPVGTTRICRVRAVR